MRDFRDRAAVWIVISIGAMMKTRAYRSGNFAGLSRPTTQWPSESSNRQRHSARGGLRKIRRRCEEIEFEAWRRRGLWHKAKDNAFYMLNEVL